MSAAAENISPVVEEYNQFLERAVNGLSTWSEEDVIHCSIGCDGYELSPKMFATKIAGFIKDKDELGLGKFLMSQSQSYILNYLEAKHELD